MANRKQILVVEDDAQVRLIIAAALKGLGSTYHVSAVGSARAALSIASNLPFDLLVSDIRLPGMTGIHLTELFIQEHPKTSIVWITAHGCKRVADDVARLRIEACLNKPIEIGKIRDAALRALGQAGPGRDDAQADRVQTPADANGGMDARSVAAASDLPVVGT